MILQLNTRSKVDWIKILTDKDKVPSSLDIFLGDFAEETLSSKNILFSKIGSIYPRNQEYEGVGRQYHTIELDARKPSQTTCSFVKILFKSNQISKNNEFNQVSIVGIDIYGMSLVQTSEKGEIKHDSVDYIYTDSKVLKIRADIREKMKEAVEAGQLDILEKLKRVDAELKFGGETLAAMAVECRKLLDAEKYHEARDKREESLQFRNKLLNQQLLRHLLDEKKLKGEDAQDLKKLIKPSKFKELSNNAIK